MPDTSLQPGGQQPPLLDPFGRTVTYLRLSLTDRCDFRCVYCMSETMQFLPRSDLLDFDEIDRLVGLFTKAGIRKLRLTGGEPLVRKSVLDLIGRLGGQLSDKSDTVGLDELTLTTNGSQLPTMAQGLADAGVKRINVSMDSIRPERFSEITRRGRLDQVLNGLQAAKAAGLNVKINMVAMRGINDDEFDDMIHFCGREGFDLTLIEVMPMADSGLDRRSSFLPLTEVRSALENKWTLTPISDRTGGPARYVRVEETGQKLGFISPLTENFCTSCNRIRLTSTGKLYLCLGQSDAIDFREAMRGGMDDKGLTQLIHKAMGLKPKGHDFDYSGESIGDPGRHMSVTGG